MSSSKPVKQRKRKFNTVSQIIQNNWITDICWKNLTTDQKQWIWKLQNELQKLYNKNEKLQLKKIDEIIIFIYSYCEQKEQLEILQWLIFQQNNIMLVMKFFFKKSMIMQMMFCLLHDSVVLIILLLNAIETEQTIRIEDLEDTWSVFVSCKTIFTVILINIHRDVYTHILLSSKFLIEKKFHSILIDFIFCNHVKLIIVDEMHLVTDWSQFFHAIYIQFWKLQMLLDQKSWFTCIATLNEQISVIVWQLIEFNNDVKIFHISIVTDSNKKSLSRLFNMIIWIARRLKRL